MKTIDKNILSQGLGQIDLDIIELITHNPNNKRLSTDQNIPLSTIQHRTKTLFENEFITSKVHINYEKLGYKRWLLHIYLFNGDLENIFEKLSQVIGIESLLVQIGNPDIFVRLLYKNSPDLLKVITSIRKSESIQKVLWSEQMLEHSLQNSIPKIL